MAKKATFWNQKGGVGKSWFAQMASRILGAADYRVLLADMDPQASLSENVGRFEVQDYGVTPSVYDLIRQPGKHRTEEAVIQLDGGISLIRGDARMEDIERSLPILAFKSAIAQLEGDFDFILMDCAGSVNNITQAALLASDIVIVPSIPQVDDLGVTTLSVERAVQMAPEASIKVVLNQVAGRKDSGFLSKADQEALEIFKKELGGVLCSVAIPDTELVRRYKDRNERINTSEKKRDFFDLCVASVAEMFEIRPPKIQEF